MNLCVTTITGQSLIITTTHLLSLYERLQLFHNTATTTQHQYVNYKPYLYYRPACHYTEPNEQLRRMDLKIKMMTQRHYEPTTLRGLLCYDKTRKLHLTWSLNTPREAVVGSLRIEIHPRIGFMNLHSLHNLRLQIYPYILYLNEWTPERMPEQNTQMKLQRDKYSGK
jgi:hypothetical protein